MKPFCLKNQRNGSRVLGTHRAGDARAREFGLTHRAALLAALAVLAGLLISMGSYTFVYARGYSYMSDRSEACINCHVMQEQYNGWIKGSHKHAASCNDCASAARRRKQQRAPSVEE